MFSKNYQRKLTILAVTAIAAALAGCGKSDSGSAAGAVSQPLYPGGGTGGCMPISQPLSFTASNIRFDSANIIGGTLPSGPAIGAIALGGGAGGGPFQGQGLGGTISLNYIPVNAGTTYTSGYPGNVGGYPGYTGGYPGYGGGSNIASATGYIQLSAPAIQAIAEQVASGQIPLGLQNTAVGTPPVNNPYGGYGGYGGNGYGYGYPGYGGGYGGGYVNPQLAQQICVSAIAMNIGHSNYHVYGGDIYLYLNNTQHGYRISF